jgi:hypothetical protein
MTLYLNITPLNNLFIHTQTLVPEAAGYYPFISAVFHSEGKCPWHHLMDCVCAPEPFPRNVKDRVLKPKVPTVRVVELENPFSRSRHLRPK